MRAARALGRRIAVRTALFILGVLGLSAAGAFALYGWVFENYPDAVASPQAWRPQSVDYVALASAAVVALIGATVASMGTTSWALAADDKIAMTRVVIGVPAGSLDAIRGVSGVKMASIERETRIQ